MKALLCTLALMVMFGMLASPVRAQALQPPAPSAMPGAPGSPQPASDAAVDEALVARVVYGILSYSYWPDDKTSRVLCVVGQSRYAMVLQASASSQGRERIAVRFSTVEEVISEQPCDAIYIGRLQEVQLARLLRATTGKPVVTLLEHSQFCDEGALICLQAQVQAQTPDSLTFQVNLDAVSLSQVRVSPQVLKMSRGLAAPRRAP